MRGSMRTIGGIVAMVIVVAGCGSMTPTAAPLATHDSTPAVASASTSTPTATPAPPAPAVVCGGASDRLGLDCDALAALVLHAVEGVQRTPVALAITPYGYPCGDRFPAAVPTEGCLLDADEGPVAWVRFAEGPTAVLRIDADDGTGAPVAQLVDFGTTPLTAQQLVDAAAFAPTPAPAATMPPFPGAPALELADGTAVEPVIQGGCGYLAYKGEITASDQCGPTMLDDAIKGAATTVKAGSRLTLVAQGGWRFGADDALIAAGRATPWVVRVGATSHLAGKEEGELKTPYDIGRELAEGMQPLRVIKLRAPSTPGDYLLQVNATYTWDGWTDWPGTWYWHIRVR